MCTIKYADLNNVVALQAVCTAVLANWEQLSSTDGSDGRVSTVHLTVRDTVVPITVSTGICSWVGDYLEGDDLASIYEDWELFSGDLLYPVGYGECDYDKDGLNKYTNPERRKLVEWVLECCNEFMEESGHA